MKPPLRSRRGAFASPLEPSPTLLVPLEIVVRVAQAGCTLLHDGAVLAQGRAALQGISLKVALYTGYRARPPILHDGNSG